MDSDWFKNRMRELGVSQEAIAARLGRERTSIVRILAGKQPMRLDEALIFADMLKSSYREIVEKALDLPAGGLRFDDGGAVRLRYRVAAIESGAGPFDFGEAAPTLSAPPRWRRTPHAFAAEIADRSFDLRYTPGTIVYCTPPEELGRALRAGDACVLLHLSDGEPFEVRGGIVAASPTPNSFIVAGASSDPKLSWTVWFDRPTSEAMMKESFGAYRDGAASAEFPYRPHPSDKARIIGVVTAALRPEA